MNDGEMLFVTQAGHEQRGNSLVRCAGMCPGHHDARPLCTLADYLGVGTGELVQSGSVGDGWSRPLRWHAIKPEIDADEVRAALRFYDLHADGLTLRGHTVRAVLAVWLKSREPQHRRVQFHRRPALPPRCPCGEPIGGPPCTPSAPCVYAKGMPLSRWPVTA